MPPAHLEMDLTPEKPGAISDDRRGVSIVIAGCDCSLTDSFHLASLGTGAMQRGSTCFSMAIGARLEPGVMA